MRAVAIASDRSLQAVDYERPVPGAGEVLSRGATQQVKVLLSPRPGGPSSAGA